MEYSSHNQRRIFIIREKEVPFDGQCNAHKRLKPVGFKQWHFFCMNVDGYELLLNNALFLNHGFTERERTSGWNELKEKGFITPQKGGRKKDYCFYEYPPEHKLENDKSSFLESTKCRYQKRQNVLSENDKSSQANKEYKKNNEKDKDKDKNQGGVQGGPSSVPEDGTHPSRPQEHSNFVKNEVANELADNFKRRGFKYAGKGKGGLEGLIARYIKEGYTENDLLRAFNKMADASKGNPIKDHVPYFSSILKSMRCNSECENLKPEETKVTTSDKIVKEAAETLIDHGIKYDDHGLRGLVETLESIKKTYGEDILWDAVDLFMLQEDPDYIRNPNNYLWSLAQIKAGY